MEDKEIYDLIRQYMIDKEIKLLKLDCSLSDYDTLTVISNH